MVTEMVERVAKAIAGHEIPNNHDDLSAVYMGGSDYPIDCYEIARAAIEAMREPTEAMCRGAMYSEYRSSERQVIWETMIDAALKGE